VPARDFQKVRPAATAVPGTKPAPAGAFAAPAGAKYGSADLLRQGGYAQAQGDLAAAKSAFNDARQAAKTEKTTGLEAQAALQYARTIQSLETSQLTKEHVAEAKTAYADAIRLGTPQQRVHAQNDLAILSLRQGDPQQAVAMLRRVDVGALEPGERSLYAYNYGRALELSGNGPEAYQKYTQVLEQSPEFDLASEGAFRLLRASRPARVGEAARLAEMLLGRGQQESAVRELRRALEIWAAEPDAQRLLAVLVRYFVAARIDPRQFRKNEWPALRSLSERGPRLAPAIKQIATAYEGKVPTFVERGSARGFFDAWSPESWKSEPFSRLLKTIGDSYDRAEQPRQALALYSGAWSLDPTNTEAALYVALILRDHADGLDPGGRLLSRMTESVFEEKGIAYQKQDWLNILRQHVLLATLFEKEGKWGPRGNPRSAIFQWTNALRADDRIRQRDPNFPLSPAIYLHLGECHMRVGDPDLAWNAYAKASYAFLKSSKPEDAAAALERARSLAKFMTPQQLETVRTLENAIARARKAPG
jgi:tetratricopeptide (TPR) repeat protein